MNMNKSDSENLYGELVSILIGSVVQCQSEMYKYHPVLNLLRQNKYLENDKYNSILQSLSGFESDKTKEKSLYNYMKNNIHEDKQNLRTNTMKDFVALLT